MTIIEINCKNYSNFIKIGTGINGNVYRAEDKKTGLYVVIKEIDKERINQSEDILKDEIEIMKKIKNENSIELKDIIDTNKYFYIIMDFCEYNLESYLKRKRKNGLSVIEIKNILIQLNNTFKLMLKEKIIHKNLKPSNILISLDRLDKCLIKLSSFTSSKYIDSSNTNIDIPLIMAPEIINDDKDLSKCDLWSLGILIYYMYFREYPYNGKNEYILFKDINSGKKLKIIDNKELNDLMNKLLKVNVEERLSWEEYFNHSFFNNIIEKENKENELLISKLEEINRIKDEKIKSLEKELENMKKENIDALYKDFNIELKNPIYTLNNHSDSIFCLALLNDGRFCSGSGDDSIIIYNKETYKPDIIIKEHSNFVLCLTQLKNGILASSSYDSTIKLFSINKLQYEVIQILNLHKGAVYRIIELSNNNLVSCSKDSTIIFYTQDGLQYNKEYSITASEGIINIIQTKQNEIVYSTNNKKIHFFDFNERKEISILENISCDIFGFRGCFCMITNDLLLIPGENMINIINVNEYQKINEIYIPDLGRIYGISMLNSNMLITSENGKRLRQWKIEENNLILISKKENAHNDEINVILNLKNGHIVTGCWDGIIKIW